MDLGSEYSKELTIMVAQFATQFELRYMGNVLTWAVVKDHVMCHSPTTALGISVDVCGFC